MIYRKLTAVAAVGKNILRLERNRRRLGQWAAHVREVQGLHTGDDDNTEKLLAIASILSLFVRSLKIFRDGKLAK